MPRISRRVPLAPIVGVILGLVIAFAVIRMWPKPKAAPSQTKDPQALAGAVLPEDAGALDEVLFHYVARLEPVIAGPYKDFLLTLDPKTRLVAVVARGEADALHKFLRRIDVTFTIDARTRVVEVEGPISTWSKDRALVTGPAKPGDRTGLLVPAPPDGQWKERANDWHTLAFVASAMPERYYVNELPLVFDAGDFAVTGSRVVIDVNLYVKNRPRGIASPAAMRELIAKLLARDVVMLGADDGDVPRHHMSMYMTPVGDGVVLVGDPRAAIPVVGDKYVPGEQSPETGEPLRADFSDAMLARFDRAARELEAAGFRVVRIPTVPFDDKTYFAYTNGVYETRAGKKIAWVPQYGEAKLDEMARAVYAGLGWEVRPVAVRVAYPFHGTIGCLVNVLARG